MADEAPTDTQDPAAQLPPPQPQMPLGQAWETVKAMCRRFSPDGEITAETRGLALQSVEQFLVLATSPPPVPPAPEPNRETRRAAGERSAPRTPRPRTPKPRAGKKS